MKNTIKILALVATVLFLSMVLLPAIEAQTIKPRVMRIDKITLLKKTFQGELWLVKILTDDDAYFYALMWFRYPFDLRSLV